ncbi:MAG: hypothetical protein R2799_16475 [Crocinitomicaceae bacterium]
MNITLLAMMLFCLVKINMVFTIIGRDMTSMISIGNHWSPFLLELKAQSSNLLLDKYGGGLKLSVHKAIYYIYCISEGYLIEINKSRTAQNTIQKMLDKGFLEEYNDDDYLFRIKQNENDVDVDDRIELGLDLIKIMRKFSK